MPQLVINESEKELIKTIEDNKITIVVGETGCGKTTGLPVMLYKNGLHKNRVIGITEPRRIAAVLAAKQVARELKLELGKEVGYRTRFEKLESEKTKVRYITDGTLLQELRKDPKLSKYSIIMVDEVHERSVNIDLLMGFLKDLLKNRNDLKVIFVSATLDEKKFSDYFKAPIVKIKGRTFPVTIRWSKTDFEPHETDKMIARVVLKVQDICRESQSGDILVFAPGEEEIFQIIARIGKFGLKDMTLLPLHSTLPPEERSKVFDNQEAGRRVIVATNIAETSVTLNGIEYVVDSGLIKRNRFHPDLGIESLDVVEHSQAGCIQRAGRASRIRAGLCFRLYTEESFANRPQFTELEIKRVGLAGVVLKLRSIGIKNPLKFKFLDPPDKKALEEAEETLVALEAISKDDETLTELGEKMACLPLHPRIARMVIEAEKYGCAAQTATIAALQAVNNIFLRPRGQEKLSDAALKPFKDPRSDGLTLLNAWNAYEAVSGNPTWCHESFLNGRALKEVGHIRSQIFRILYEENIETEWTKDDENILKSVASGLINNLLQRTNGHSYSGGVRNLENVYIHPGSSLFNNDKERQDWIVSSDIVETTKRYARNCTAVKIEWLPELAPFHFWLGEKKDGKQQILHYDKEGKETVAGIVNAK